VDLCRLLSGSAFASRQLFPGGVEIQSTRENLGDATRDTRELVANREVPAILGPPLGMAVYSFGSIFWNGGTVIGSVFSK
jgi:hypothetical protein